MKKWRNLNKQLYNNIGVMSDTTRKAFALKKRFDIKLSQNGMICNGAFWKEINARTKSLEDFPVQGATWHQIKQRARAQLR